MFGVALLTLRHRPWSPRLSSWIVVGISAATGGSLLGLAFDKMVVESLGFGGWLRGGCLFAMGILSPLIVANTVMYGRGLPTLPGDPRSARLPHHLADANHSWHRVADHDGVGDRDGAWTWCSIRAIGIFSSQR